MAGDHVRVLFLPAEAAAGRHLDDADAFLVEAEHAQQRLVDVERALDRAHHHQRAVVVEVRGDAVVLDVGVLLMRDEIFTFDDDLGAAHRLVDARRARS